MHQTGVESRFLSRPSRSQVTIQTELVAGWHSDKSLVYLQASQFGYVTTYSASRYSLFPSFHDFLLFMPKDVCLAPLRLAMEVDKFNKSQFHNYVWKESVLYFPQFL